MSTLSTWALWLVLSYSMKPNSFLTGASHPVLGILAWQWEGLGYKERISPPSLAGSCFLLHPRRTSESKLHSHRYLVNYSAIVLFVVTEFVVLLSYTCSDTQLASDTMDSSDAANQGEMVWDYELLEWVVPDSQPVPHDHLEASLSDEESMDVDGAEYLDEVRRINEEKAPAPCDPVNETNPPHAPIGETPAVYNPFEGRAPISPPAQVNSMDWCDANGRGPLDPAIDEINAKHEQRKNRRRRQRGRGGHSNQDRRVRSQAPPREGRAKLSEGRKSNGVSKGGPSNSSRGRGRRYHRR